MSSITQLGADQAAHAEQECRAISRQQRALPTVKLRGSSAPVWWNPVPAGAGTVYDRSKSDGE